MCLPVTKLVFLNCAAGFEVINSNTPDTKKAPYNDAFFEPCKQVIKPVTECLLGFVFKLLSAYGGFIHQSAACDGKYSHAAVIIRIG